MSHETNTPPPVYDRGFILPLEPDGAAIGGKARGLARLAALGLPTPLGFAVGEALWRLMRARGPSMPARLASSEQLALLNTARAAMLTTDFPARFDQALAQALDELTQATSPTRKGPLTYAVRSSGDAEDQLGALGAGVYESALRVPRADVPAAIHRVLASFLTPAAWVYRATRRDALVRAGQDTFPSVLIHAFVDGEATGIAAGDATPEHDVRIDVTHGTATERARAQIVQAVRQTAEAHGPIELEWVASDDRVIFLQMRAHHAVTDGPAKDPRGTRAGASAFAPALGDDGKDRPWTWDAAHNPLPLSPAQAGLVEWVDERCHLEFQQKIVHGYLFVRPRAISGELESPPVTDARTAFDHLTATIVPRLDALGAEPSLDAALEVFVAAYEPLFGIVGPACARARKALADFVGRYFPDRAGELSILLLGVPSVARQRHAAADDIARARGPEACDAAIAAYLNKFGDESPRWDVVEPTLKETPERLLLVATTKSSGARSADGPAAPHPEDRAIALARELRDRLPAADVIQFDNLLAAARQAVAVGEDDDALFARLQAAVRHALLAMGLRLRRKDLLDDVTDVFFLPLSVAQSWDTDVPPSRTGSDLRRLSASGRRAFQIAAETPPSLPTMAGTHVIRGRAGAGGKVIGRAVRHPASAPFGPGTCLVAATLLPTELPLLFPAAIVVETGHALGHVAAQARERSIPAVVGATGAVAAIAEGALIVVDGDRGEVILLDET